jgi:acetyl-CoA acetyltransferase
MHVHHALAAINAGIIDIAVVVARRGRLLARKNPAGREPRAAADPWAQPRCSRTPYGTPGAPSNYSHAMTRHMHRYGTTKEDFAQIAVTTRDWATLNPRASCTPRRRTPPVAR